MLTEFGKVLKKIRVDRNEILKDMANKLGVTVSYLSAIENGKREVPDNWINKIKSNYRLSSKESSDLENSFFESKKEISIKLSNLNDTKKQAAIAFAREFEEFSDEEIKAILKIIKK